MTMEREASFFDTANIATATLITVNCLVFALCLVGNSPMVLSTKTLFYAGAVYSEALARHEYWRFFAYAFLHANIIHIGMNMLCLVMWAPLLERRVGATNFLFIYIVSAVFGGVASLYGHTGPFISVGASGAISGVVGALLALTLLRKLPLPPQFFVVTIGLNAALIAVAPNVDWMAHLGGLLAGLATTALIASVAALDWRWLRCKFPEFLKLAIVVAVAAAAVIGLPDPVLVLSGGAFPQVVALAAGAALLVKGADLLLTQLRGLAVVVIAVALLYAALPIIFADTINSLSELACSAAGADDIAARIAGLVCQGAGAVPYLLALGILLLVLRALWRELQRGWYDVGFIRNALMAERNRVRGL